MWNEVINLKFKFNCAIEIITWFFFSIFELKSASFPSSPFPKEVMLKSCDKIFLFHLGFLVNSFLLSKLDYGE